VSDALTVIVVRVHGEPEVVQVPTPAALVGFVLSEVQKAEPVWLYPFRGEPIPLAGLHMSLGMCGTRSTLLAPFAPPGFHQVRIWNRTLSELLEEEAAKPPPEPSNLPPDPGLSSS
jgi:hypothetical protein